MVDCGLDDACGDCRRSFQSNESVAGSGSMTVSAVSRSRVSMELWLRVGDVMALQVGVGVGAGGSMGAGADILSVCTSSINTLDGCSDP